MIEVLEGQKNSILNKAFVAPVLCKLCGKKNWVATMKKEGVNNCCHCTEQFEWRIPRRSDNWELLTG